MVTNNFINYKRVEVHQLLVKNIKEHILYVEDVEKILSISKKKDVHHADSQMPKLEDVNYFKINKQPDLMLYK